MPALKRIFYSSIFVGVLIIALLFFLKNNQVMEFDYLLGIIQLPLSMLLLGSICVGVVLGMLAMLPLVFRLKRQKTRLQKQAQQSQKEIDNLRVLPVRDSH